MEAGRWEVEAVDCFYWWQPWPVCSGDDSGVERETQWRGDNTNIDFHLSAGVEQDIFTPPGPGPGREPVAEEQHSGLRGQIQQLCRAGGTDQFCQIKIMQHWWR